MDKKKLEQKLECINIEIFNYLNKKKSIKLNLEKIRKIIIYVVTGDEICEVEYKNGKFEKYDSSNTRTVEFIDGNYCIYDITRNINLIDKFKKRVSSYDTKWMKNINIEDLKEE